MKKYFLFFLLISVNLFSQVGGERVYSFLNIPNSARQSALSGDVTTIANDVNQLFYNPAFNFVDEQSHIGLNYLNYLADINMYSLAFNPSISILNSNLHFGIQYLNYGNFIESDIEGNELGQFSAHDFLALFGFSSKIKSTNIKYGINFKFINSGIDTYTSSGIASDIAISYTSLSERTFVTFILSNFGFQIDPFDETKEKLPFQIKLGVSHELTNVPLKFHLSLNNLQRWDLAQSNPSNTQVDLNGTITLEDINVFDEFIRHLSLGIELFPVGGFSTQLGYNFRRGNEMKLTDQRTFAGLTAGFSLQRKRFRFSYSFAKFHPAANSNTFSLDLNLF